MDWRVLAWVLAILLAVVGAEPSTSGSLHQHLEDLDPDEAAEAVIDALLPLQNGTASEAFWRLADLAGFTVTNDTVPAGNPSWLTDAPQELQGILATLWGAIEYAEAKVEAAFANVTAEEQAWLLDNSGVMMQVSQATSTGEWTQDDVDFLVSYLENASALDLHHLVQAELALLRATESVRSGLETLDPLSGSASDCATGDVVFATPDCRVIVGNNGSNEYDQNAVLSIDLGGNDVYRNNAGGTVVTLGTDDVSVAVAIDVKKPLESSNDTYEHLSVTRCVRAGGTLQEPGGMGVQGAGCLGVGLLADLGGNDTYSAQTNRTGFGDDSRLNITAQGAGLMGAGVLWDACVAESAACSDIYESNHYARGAGVLGFGLLLDEGGAELYRVAESFDSEGGHGTGCAPGFGALIDLHPTAFPEANDVHNGTGSDYQGMACATGLGILFDAAGDDAYTVLAGRGEILGGGINNYSGFSQGFGESRGLGILLDQGGSDSYFVQDLNSSVTYQAYNVQGVGAAPGSRGMLLDLDLWVEAVSNDDTYFARQWAQGAARDGPQVSPNEPEPAGAQGVLWDAAGIDSYSASIQCQGYGSRGLGFLRDFGLDMDSYSDCGSAYDCTLTSVPTTRGNDRRWCANNKGIGEDGLVPPRPPCLFSIHLESQDLGGSDDSC